MLDFAIIVTAFKMIRDNFLCGSGATSLSAKHKHNHFKYMAK